MLPPGYRMELVVAEPDVISPAVIRFDGNGRMYVAEFITYMRDADGNNQHTPESRITRFESTKGDGVYDKRTVFVDKLVLPRTVVPLDGNSILTNETASDDVVKYTDTNNDGVADKREHFYSGIGLGRDGNLEHEQAGFVWGLDNWIYTTYNAFRFRWTPTGILKEPTGPNGGQWGVTMDDDGKMWFIDAGGERGPMNFQVPIHYGAFTVPDQYEPGFHIVWPESGLSDTQGGMIRVRMPVGTAQSSHRGVGRRRRARAPRARRSARRSAGHRAGRPADPPRADRQDRGAHAAPQRLSGIGVPAQHRSAVPADQHHDRAGRVRLHRGHVPRHHPGIELDAAGIVPAAQDRAVSARQGHRPRPDLAAALRRRSWRAGDAGRSRRAGDAGDSRAARAGARPHAAAHARADAAQLVPHLSHQNGWWRDTAQQLLVQRQDKSVVPALQNIVRTSDNLVARFHALWTLEGLGALDAALVREQMKDSNPRMRVQAIRASETLYKAGDRPGRRLPRDGEGQRSRRRAAGAADREPVQAAQRRGAHQGDDGVEQGERRAGDRPARAAAHRHRGRDVGRRLLARAAGADEGRRNGLQEPVLDLPWRGRPRRGRGRVDGRVDDGAGARRLAAGAGASRLRDQDAAARHDRSAGRPDLHAGDAADGRAERSVDREHRVVHPQRVRQHGGVHRAGRRRPRARGDGEPQGDVDVPELEVTLPRLLPADPTWKATASHNAERAASGLTLAAWTTGVPQEPDMWFQVELPQPAMITEVQFDAGAPGGGGRGRGGRGAPPAAGRGGAPAERQRGHPWRSSRNASARRAPGGGRGGAPVFGSFPIAYKVQLSMDGKTWGAPVAQGEGAPATTIATFRRCRRSS